MNREYIFIVIAVVLFMSVLIYATKRSSYSGPINIQTPEPPPFRTPEPPPFRTPTPIPIPKTPEPCPVSKTPVDAIIIMDGILITFSTQNVPPDQKIQMDKCLQGYYDFLKKSLGGVDPGSFFGFKPPTTESKESYALVMDGLNNLLNKRRDVFKPTLVQDTIIKICPFMARPTPTYSNRPLLDDNLRECVKQGIIGCDEYVRMQTKDKPNVDVCFQILSKLFRAASYPL